MGLTVLKTPVRAPQAHAVCEHVIGTIRRECLDFMIPLSDTFAPFFRSGSVTTTAAGHMPV